MENRSEMEQPRPQPTFDFSLTSTEIMDTLQREIEKLLDSTPSPESLPAVGSSPGPVSYSPARFGTSPPPQDRVLRSYIHRLVTYMRCPLECFIIAVGLMQRLKKSLQELQQEAFLPWTEDSCRRWLLACTVLAIKNHSDQFEQMNYYAHVGGVPPAHLRQLEVEVFVALSFSPRIDASHFFRICGVEEEEEGDVANPSSGPGPKTLQNASVDSCPSLQSCCSDPEGGSTGVSPTNSEEPQFLSSALN